MTVVIGTTFIVAHNIVACSDSAIIFDIGDTSQLPINTAVKVLVRHKVYGESAVTAVGTVEVAHLAPSLTVQRPASLHRASFQ